MSSGKINNLAFVQFARSGLDDPSSTLGSVFIVRQIILNYFACVLCRAREFQHIFSKLFSFHEIFMHDEHKWNEKCCFRIAQSKVENSNYTTHEAPLTLVRRKLRQWKIMYGNFSFFFEDTFRSFKVRLN